MLQVGGFLLVLLVSSTNKTDRHDITEILLKVALNTINLIISVDKMDIFAINNPNFLTNLNVKLIILLHFLSNFHI